ncbi:ALK and LTK ligand 2 [Rhinatrema bivittatum]|uniref:ALK and LTK ligand 2 n=1 Tax=Rhinatrema bivittatum TaxID=194408 RepID=UPI00112AEA7E|nr:ALK and LTK ligand 2 [Rhinatrema bivittatum]
MKMLRSLAWLALVLLMLPAGCCKERTEAMEVRGDRLLHFIVELLRNVKEYNFEEANGVEYFSKQEDHVFGHKELSDDGHYQEERRVEIVPRDLRVKDKFLNHLTGPLNFSPKCSKHFHRLYHTTRDCTIPAYYKRCARLLTRLAVSPLCIDG